MKLKGTPIVSVMSSSEEAQKTAKNCTKMPMTSEARDKQTQFYRGVDAKIATARSAKNSDLVDSYKKVKKLGLSLASVQLKGGAPDSAIGLDMKSGSQKKM